MNTKRLLSYTRQAVDDYKMILPGDKVAVGISGGKDSIALLYALKALQRFYPNPFKLEAITVTLGFNDFDTVPIQALCDDLGIPYHVVSTQIADIVFNERAEKNPCSLCAKMRKGALYGFAKEHGFTKVAFGHHKDDIVETLMMSLFYEGRIHTFAPITYLDKSGITCIRPLIYCREHEIRSFIKKADLSIVKSPCPADGNTKREYMKQTLRDLSDDNRDLMKNMFRAVSNSQIDTWPNKNLLD